MGTSPPEPGVTDPAELPHVDDHETLIAADPDVVWRALDEAVKRDLQVREGHPLALVLGTDPPSGFAISQTEYPERLVLVGAHRFSRYRLTFTMTADGEQTRLRATTDASFPGVAGGVYRLLVITSGAHAAVTARFLRVVRNRAARGSQPCHG
jgi:hypothetical protein